MLMRSEKAIGHVHTFRETTDICCKHEVSSTSYLELCTDRWECVIRTDRSKDMSEEKNILKRRRVVCIRMYVKEIVCLVVNCD
jgi:hypothetical protein